MAAASPPTHASVQDIKDAFEKMGLDLSALGDSCRLTLVPAVVATLGHMEGIINKFERLLQGIPSSEVVKKTNILWELGYNSKFSVYIVDRRITELLMNLACNEKEIDVVATTLAKYSNKTSDWFAWFLWIGYRIWNGVKAIFKLSDWQIARRLIASKFEKWLLEDAKKSEDKRAFHIASGGFDSASEMAAELFLMQVLYVNKGSLSQFNFFATLRPLKPAFGEIVESDDFLEQVAQEVFQRSTVPSPKPHQKPLGATAPSLVSADQGAVQEEDEKRKRREAAAVGTIAALFGSQRRTAGVSTK